MRLFNSNGNIELYCLRSVDLINVIVSNSTVSNLDKIWLKGDSRGGVDGSRVKNVGKLYLLFTKILQYDLRRPRSQSHKLYWSIPLTKFLRYVPNKNDVACIKRLLKASGIIDINEKSSSGGSGYKAFSQSFRLNKKYEECKLVPLYSIQTEQYFFLQKAYDNWGNLSEIKKEEEGYVDEAIDFDGEDNQKVEAANDTFFNWLHDCHRKVRIDMVSVTKTLDDYIKHSDPTKRITHKEYNKAQLRADTIFNFNSNHKVSDTFKRSKLVGRIFNNINGLNKIIRHALSFNNNNIYWVDVHAAHPFLLMDLYNDLPQSKEVLREKKEYHELWTKGQKNFYLNFSSIGGRVGSVNSLKKMFLGKDGIYSRYRSTRKNYIDKVYSKHFPILDKRIETIKTVEYLPKDDFYWDGYEERLAKKREQTRSRNKLKKQQVPLPTDVLYSQLACINQRLESKLVIDLACKGYEEEFKKNSFALIMHDAIGVKAKHVRDIKRHLKKAFVDVVGKRPIFS
ncbi:hypothetical protein N8676_00630 [bacterium]|nr:hypothetical protein [bacterium]